MARILQHKVVASLPAELEANSLYFVRAGNGFDLYVTNSAGTIVPYSLNREPPIDAGTSSQFWRGDKSWQDVAAAVGDAVLTGLSAEPASPIAATDTLLAALGKLQAQLAQAPKPMIGEIRGWATATPPAGWLACDGSAVSRSQYDKLFAVIGTTHGAGDGATTFNLPNAAGRVMRGAGMGKGIGTIGGLDSVSLTIRNLPMHSHPLSSGTASTDMQMATVATNPASNAANGNVIGTSGGGPGTAAIYMDKSALSGGIAHYGQITTTLGGNTENVGGGEPIGVSNPYFVGSYIIAYDGIQAE